MALSDNARVKLNTAAGDISVGNELQTKIADITGTNTFTGAVTFSTTITVTGAQTLTGDTTLSGAINHDGTTIGFFTVTPTTRATAYTQTYATADKTHANATSADLATTAVTQTTPYGYATAAQGDDVAVQFNALRVDVLDVKQLVNSIIDDLQLYGLLQ